MSPHVDNLALSVNNSDPEAIWMACMRIIEENVSAQSYKTWFMPIKPQKLEDKVLTIQVPSQFFYEWLEEHYPLVLRGALKEIIGEGAQPAYTILNQQDQKQLNLEILRYRSG